MIIHLLCSIAGFSIVLSKKPDITFNTDDLEEFRELIIDEIKSEASGLIPSNPLVSIFDGVKFSNDPLILFNPLVAGLIRLAFHDCSSENVNNPNANKFNQFICDGCLKMDHPDHKGLKEGAVEPIEDICALYYDKGLSRADCWALAATVAVEVGANNTLSNKIRAIVGSNPTTVDLLPGDIPYLIGRQDCDTSPETKPGFVFEPFNPFDGWDITSTELKKRFGFDNNREVVAIIGGGHSVGNGHFKISGFVGGWDISQDAVDNDYFKTLLNRDATAQVIGLNLDFYQAREIDFDLPDLMELINGSRTKRNFLVNIPPAIQPILFLETSPFRPRNFKYFNVDVSMAFDLRKFVENGDGDNVTCHTDAFSVCGDKMVLIDGYEIDTEGIDEQTICEFKQCPLQCPDGNGGFDRFNDTLTNEDLYDIDPDTDCIRAIYELFARDNVIFMQTFAEAFTKMISTGYKKGKSDNTKLFPVPCPDDNTNQAVMNGDLIDTEPQNKIESYTTKTKGANHHVYIYIGVSIICMLLLVSIGLILYRKRRKNLMEKMESQINEANNTMN